MNPNVELYRALGRPATASVIVLKVPTGTPTVTINGVVYTYGTNFVGQTVHEIAKHLCAAVNADRSLYGFGHDKTNPISLVWAMYYGATVILIATEPGTGGNSLTLATSSAEHFTVSGATFSGGAAAAGTFTIDTTGLATSAKQDTLLTELQAKADLTETQPTSDNGPAWTSVFGVSGAAVVSADLTSATAVTDAPTSGQKLVIRDIVISADTAMNVLLEEETSGTDIFKVFIPANGTVQLTPRSKIKLATADKKLTAKASVAGNIAVTVTYNSEA